MWTDSDTINETDIRTFMAGFHENFRLEDFSAPEQSAAGWKFHCVAPRGNPGIFWIVTTRGWLYEVSPRESELLEAFAYEDEYTFKCLARRKGHLPRNILGFELHLSV